MSTENTLHDGRNNICLPSSFDMSGLTPPPFPISHISQTPMSRKGEHHVHHYDIPVETRAYPLIAFIELTQGKQAIVSAQDYEWLNKFKWCFDGRYAKSDKT